MSRASWPQSSAATPHDNYRTLAESTTDGPSMADIEGAIPFANAQMARMLGCTLPDVLQRQLEAQKMEAIRHLAGGVAHDFNNLLTVIGGYATLLRRRFDERSPGFEEASEIERAAHQGAVLTRQLLTFSCQETLKVQLLDVDEVITNLENMLDCLMTNETQLVMRLNAGPSRVSADIGQLEQIVTNLCTNARDAMPDGGPVLIQTETVSFDRSTDDVPVPGSGSPEDYVRIRVSDRGIGMDESTRSRIFDPFFTTKGPEKGTGLGLSSVYGIVQQHEGLISVHSQPDKGTSIDIHLPCAPPHDDSETPRPDIARHTAPPIATTTRHA